MPTQLSLPTRTQSQLAIDWNNESTGVPIGSLVNFNGMFEAATSSYAFLLHGIARVFLVRRNMGYEITLLTVVGKRQ